MIVIFWTETHLRFRHWPETASGHGFQSPLNYKRGWCEECEFTEFRTIEIDCITSLSTHPKSFVDVESFSPAIRTAQLSWCINDEHFHEACIYRSYSVCFSFTIIASFINFISLRFTSFSTWLRSPMAWYADEVKCRRSYGGFHAFDNTRFFFK